MKKKRSVISVAGILLLICMCYHGVPQKERLAYIGSTLITRQDADAFSTVFQYYPNPPEEFYLGTKPQIEAMVETEAIYRKTRWNLTNIKLRNGLEWQWRERYYISALFTEKILRENFGYTDKELRKYYNSHKQSYASVTYDSTGKACTTGTPQPFEQVRISIAEKLFLAVRPPDSAFKSRVNTVDTGLITREWLRYLRGGEGIREVFLKKYFKEKYGREYPDSLIDFYGKGNIITPEDVEIMLSWIPANRREQIKNNPQGVNDLAQWLLRWKLFSERAAGTGYASQPAVQNTLKWVWRFEIAQRYINERIVPLVKKGVRIDTAMAVYAYWDETETPGQNVDSAGLKNSLAKQVSLQRAVKFDSLLYEIRRAEGVRFLTDWKDDKAKTPASLLRRADSLRDTGSTVDAQSDYQTLVDNFFYTKEGKKAIIEIAKIKTEQQQYREAVNSYRRFLIDNTDESKKCNYMFMIGFIYDEYCDKPALAEENYKWVLKNAPGCELADDAEFMMLHLGEQMAGVDELQSEVRRQGKKVEAAETDTAGLRVEMMPAK
ncbi:MAG: hypothetical protein JW768_08420 [Chitinispirillaceae bacterium]|nr:hypothetical protein [Chitinispirillaceae bacterium]